MNRWTAFAWCIFVTGCGLGQRATETPAHPPKIAFASVVHDFGEIAQGTKIDYVFDFSNRGGVDLTIDRTRSACGCQATVDSERMVPPGGSARLRVQCETSRAFGRQRRTVSVYSNDPASPVALLKLVGTVRAETALAPSSFYVGRVHRGERVRRDGLMRWRGEFSIDVVADDDAPFTVETSIPSASQGRGTFTLTIDENARLGPLTARVRLSGSGAQPPRAIQVVGEVVADISSVPLKAELAPANGTASVLIINAGPRAVRIVDTEWAPGTATVATVDGGKRYRIVLNRTNADAPRESELIVHTDHPEQTTLRVPVVTSTS